MIELKDVSFAYPNCEPVLDGLSLNIDTGEHIGLVGCNGAGKSTLLSLLSGINLPAGGSVSVNGHQVIKDNLTEIRRTVGMVFQNPDDQLFMPNILEDVMFGPKNYGLSQEEAKAKAEEALERMGVLHLKDRPPYKCSGGEKRSCAIATVLAMDPSYILFDEPSAFLDPKATSNFEKTVNKLDVGYIIASHDLDLILRTCKRVLIMHKGKIIADGNPDKLLRDEELLDKAGLELPASYSNCKYCPHNLWFFKENLM